MTRLRRLNLTICAFHLGFSLGRPGRGIAKLLTLGGLGIWALVEAIKVTIMSDADFDRQFN